MKSSSPDAHAALTTVQQGLAAIAALQQQTTQAHAKFLETQAEANRTLQLLLGQVQQAAAPSAAAALTPAVPARACWTESAIRLASALRS